MVESQRPPALVELDHLAYLRSRGYRRAVRAALRRRAWLVPPLGTR